MTVLTHGEFFSVTLSDGTTVLELQTPGWGLANLATPRTSETADVTGRGTSMRYVSTEVIDSTVTFQVVMNTSTDALLAELTKTLTYIRGVDGNASGKHRQSGSFIVTSAEPEDVNGVIRINVEGQGTGAVTIDTF